MKLVFTTFFFLWGVGLPVQVKGANFHLDKRDPQFPCFSDESRLCGKNYDLSKYAERARCLYEKETQLSPQCHNFLLNLNKRDPLNPCYSDVNKLCSKHYDISRYSERVQCLEKILFKTSPQCRSFVQRLVAKYEKMQGIK